jgi:hypothetical protein
MRVRLQAPSKLILGMSRHTGSVFVNWRNELELAQTLKGLLEDKVRKLGPTATSLSPSSVNDNVRNAIIYKNGSTAPLSFSPSAESGH